MDDSIFPKIRKFCTVNQYSSLGSIFSILNNDKINLHTVLTKSHNIRECLSIKRVKALPKANCTIDLRKTISTFEGQFKTMLFSQNPKYPTINDFDQSDRLQYTQLKLKQHRISLPNVQETKQFQINKFKRKKINLCKQKMQSRLKNNASRDTEYKISGKKMATFYSIKGISLIKHTSNDKEGKVSIAVGMT